MPTANISVATVPRELNKLVVTDTSDYIGVTVVSTSLTIIDPDNNTYVIELFPANFGAINGTYDVLTSVLGYPTDNYIDGVYRFTLAATLDDDSVMTSADVYYLFDQNSRIGWAERYERCLKNNNCFSDDEKEIRTEVRELIQAADEHFSQFRFSMANKALKFAVGLISKCGC
jgi:hypothetical protein